MILYASGLLVTPNSCNSLEMGVTCEAVGWADAWRTNPISIAKTDMFNIPIRCVSLSSMITKCRGVSLKLKLNLICHNELIATTGFGVWGLGFGVWGLGDRKSVV